MISRYDFFQGFDDNISSLPDNITREEGWFEGRDTNEILVRSKLGILKYRWNEGNFQGHILKYYNIDSKNGYMLSTLGQLSRSSHAVAKCFPKMVQVIPNLFQKSA